MSELLGIYVDGETKTGKGAASHHIAETLQNHGLNVYYDVAGDFFRRYTAMVRRELGLSENEALPTGETLQITAQKLYDNRRCFEKGVELGDLQRASVSDSVSVLSELALVQNASAEWFKASIEQAAKLGAVAMVLDGRNPRRRVEEELGSVSIKVPTALDLYLICTPREAARRTLLARGIEKPSDEQISAEEVAVIKRRDHDRHRAERPFLVPEVSVAFDPKVNGAHKVLEESWHPHSGRPLPLTVTLDNTHISKPDMLTAVAELAQAAVAFAKS